MKPETDLTPAMQAMQKLSSVIKRDLPELGDSADALQNQIIQKAKRQAEGHNIAELDKVVAHVKKLAWELAKSCASIEAGKRHLDYMQYYNELHVMISLGLECGKIADSVTKIE